MCFAASTGSDTEPVVDISHGVFHCHLKTLLLSAKCFLSRLISWNLTTRCLAVTGGGNVGECQWRIQHLWEGDTDVVTFLLHPLCPSLALNPSKCSVIRWLHLKMFNAIQIWSTFIISDIWALWRSALSARVPECQKLKNVGQIWMAKYNQLTPLPFRGLTKTTKATKSLGVEHTMMPVKFLRTKPTENGTRGRGRPWKRLTNNVSEDLEQQVSN